MHSLICEHVDIVDKDVDMLVVAGMAGGMRGGWLESEMGMRTA